MDIQNTIGLKIVVDTDYETTLQHVTEALKTEGFGVLTEIDVKQTLKTKIDVDFQPYKILGACNPSLAHRALSIAPDVGLLLPCNVTVSQVEDGKIQVAIIDPLVMMSVVNHPELTPVAQEAADKLNRVIAALES